MYKKLQKKLIIQTPKTHRFTIGQKIPIIQCKFPKFQIPKLQD
jgi:hypothetical protein